ncbi:MAG: IS1634 family transposase [Thaumarchaeota archaeon]|nr:IS1634 family transposase [Nitrososphaerota archaeon]
MRPVEDKNSSFRILSTKTKNIGNIALIKPILDSIGIRKIVDGYCPMERRKRADITNGEAIEAMVLNRLTSPAPLAHVEEWASQYALKETLGISPKEVNDDRLRRSLDSIYPKIDFIEDDVAIKIMTDYNIKPELIHFDSTSLYFEGQYDESDVLRLGYSRDQKPDKKQVHLTLDVDANEGMPLFHTPHNGNMVDPKMALENLNKIRERLHPDRLIMVGDRNEIDGDVALVIVRDYNLNFIAAVKMTEKTKRLVQSIPNDSFKPIAISGAEAGDYSVCDAGNAMKFSDSKGRELDARGTVVLSTRKALHDRKRREETISEIETKQKEIQRKVSLNKGLYKNKDFVSKRVSSTFEERKRFLAASSKEGDSCASVAVSAVALNIMRTPSGSSILAVWLCLMGTAYPGVIA